MDRLVRIHKVMPSADMKAKQWKNAEEGVNILEIAHRLKVGVGFGVEGEVVSRPNF
jgi:hypothetical protein